MGSDSEPRRRARAPALPTRTQLPNGALASLKREGRAGQKLEASTKQSRNLLQEIREAWAKRPKGNKEKATKFERKPRRQRNKGT